jgi:hypothetical protein
MSDIGEKVRWLVSNSDITSEAAIQFVADVFKLGVDASAFRDDVHRARRIAGGLRIVAKDEGGKTED